MSETSGLPSGGKVPVMECFTQAWRFLDRNWRGMLPAAAITAVISQIGVALVLMLHPAGAAGETMLTSALWNLIAIIPAMVGSLMFVAVVLRKAVRDDFFGRTGLAFGPDEIRLLGVTAALTCVFLPFGALAFFFLSVFVFSRLAASPEELDALFADPEALSRAMENALGPTGVLAFILFSALCLVIVAYVLTRLAMVNAAAIGERRVVIFQTWSWSRGNVLRMLAAMILTALPIVLFEGVLNSVRIEVLKALPQDASGMVTLLMVEGVTSFLLAIASIPSIALGAILYKGLRPQEFVAK